MPICTPEQLERAEAGDLDTLAALEERGLMIGAHETAAEYVARLRELEHNLQAIDQRLAETGEFEIEDACVRADRRIPAELLGPANEETWEKFRFRVDWVPGFFTDPSFSWLFGGCAYYRRSDFFALFIVRHSFAKSAKWLIYDRDELFAHETCHVARIALDSERFEEHFAYMTSRSRFRKAVGGALRSPSDTFMVLGSCLLLLVVQVLGDVARLPIPRAPFWLLFVATVAWLVVRLSQDRHVIRVALQRLEERFPNASMPVAFRCTDAELDRLARTPAAGINELVDEWTETHLRWQVIRARFNPAPARG